MARLCAEPLDTATTVWGVVSERTAQGTQPINEVTVELFLRESGDSDEILERSPVKQMLTTVDGRYLICLPVPSGGSGATKPGGQWFQLRFRKTGYRTASQPFQIAYSVWDYDAVQISLELVRD